MLVVGGPGGFGVHRLLGMAGAEPTGWRGFIAVDGHGVAGYVAAVGVDETSTRLVA